MQKSELAALDRKTTAELAPKYDENDGTKNKQEQSQPSQPEVKTVSVKTTDRPEGHNPLMVAEPSIDHSKDLLCAIYLLKTGIELDYK